MYLSSVLSDLPKFPCPYSHPTILMCVVRAWSKDGFEGSDPKLAYHRKCSDLMSIAHLRSDARLISILPIRLFVMTGSGVRIPLAAPRIPNELAVSAHIRCEPRRYSDGHPE